MPFSENATVTEYFDLFGEPGGGDWFVVTTIVRDPQYLGEPWVTTSHFKKEPDGSKWSPNPAGRANARHRGPGSATEPTLLRGHIF